MYDREALLIAALVGSMAAAQQPAVIPRQTTAAPTSTTTFSSPSKSDCDRSGSSILSAFPTPPPALTGAVPGSLGHTAYADTCAFQSNVAPESSAAYVSWNDVVYSFFSAYSPVFVRVYSECLPPEQATQAIEMLTQTLDQVLSAYSTFSASGCPGTENAVAPRETGMPGAAAAAAAAFAGVVAAL
ncbi:hypothetical protein F4778DRAFT_4777 [Xylariomycetidae sp. FL2044]|nr:hypothetical protein F4778DRAFT_4777 [Xylariomycetidae sp. FL2044]